MINTRNGDSRYVVHFTNGQQQANADAAIAKGGGGAGIGPHELLEASLATCINMWIRMQADKLGLSIRSVEVTVVLRRDHPEEAVFEYSVRIDGELTEEQRALLLQMADDCPVRRTLTKRLSFKRDVL